MFGSLWTKCRQELDVWGGDFYTDQFYAALEHLGPQLSKLNLVHVEELDFRAVKILSLTCTNISTLGLYNCGFREPTAADDEVWLLLSFYFQNFTFYVFENKVPSISTMSFNRKVFQ